MTTVRSLEKNERFRRMGLLTEPAGYVDGTNLYEYVRGSPSQFLDPLGLQAAGTPTTRPTGGIENIFDSGIESGDPLDYIGAQAAALGYVNQSLGKNDKSRIAGFVNAQIAILNALAKGDCPCLNNQEKQWL